MRGAEAPMGQDTTPFAANSLLDRLRGSMRHAIDIGLPETIRRASRNRQAGASDAILACLHGAGSGDMVRMGW